MSVNILSVTMGGGVRSLFPDRDLPIEVNKALKEGRSLNVKINDTGVLVEAYDGNDVVGAVAMDFDEWYENTL